MIACWLGFKVFSVRRCQRYTGALKWIADRPTMKTKAVFDCAIFLLSLHDRDLWYKNLNYYLLLQKKIIFLVLSFCVK